MEIIRINKSMQFPILDKPIVAALGQFDGLHEAHRVLINQAIYLAKDYGFNSAVITFEPHPDIILKKQITSTYLTPLDAKIKVLSHLGINYLIIIDFNEKIAKLSHDLFIKNFLVPLGVKDVIVGYDFRYGYRGEGNIHTITIDSGNLIETHVVDEIKYHNQKLGSTLIRKLLEEGKVEEVKMILGRYYEVIGLVVEGNQLGRKIGFPTANLALREDFAYVKSGVYGVIVDVHRKKYLGICNLGYNPSFNLQAIRRFEVHILDFEGDLYYQEIQIQFVIRLRDEMKFISKDMFIKQIQKDKTTVIEFMSSLI